MSWKSERGDPWKRRIDATVGRPLVFFTGLLRRRRAQPAGIARCGMLMLAAIGDTILSSAITQDLRRRYPNIRITAFASRANKSVVELLADFDEIVEVPASNPVKALRIIRSRPFDLLIDIGQWTRLSALLSAFSGAKFTVGFNTQGQHRHWAYDRSTPHLNSRHEMENFRALVSSIGLEALSPPRLSDSVMLPKPDFAAPYVVIHPWAAGYRFALREWNELNWVEVINHTTERGMRVVISGGPADRERALQLMQRCSAQERITVIAGRSSLKDTAAVLKHAEAVIAVNTGTMHLAALLDCPLIGLHGPTNPMRWGPLSQQAVNLGPGLDQGGAYLNLGFEYPKSPVDCMPLIKVKDVLTALDKILFRSVGVVEKAVEVAR